MGNLLGLGGQAGRLKHVLDDLSSNVMVADNDRNIVYLNKAVVAFLERSEADIRRDLPEFSVEGLVGKNIDIFHKNPAHQQKLISGMSGQFDAMIEVGGDKFDLMARPVIDGKKRLGTVVEWRDAANRIAREDAQAQVEAIRRTQAVISFMPDGNNLEANELFCGAVGYRLEEIVGQPHSLFIDPVERSGESYKGFWKALASGQPPERCHPACRLPPMASGRSMKACGKSPRRRRWSIVPHKIFRRRQLRWVRIKYWTILFNRLQLGLVCDGLNQLVLWP